MTPGLAVDRFKRLHARFFSSEEERPGNICTQQTKQGIFGFLMISACLSQDLHCGSSCVSGDTCDCVGQTMGQALTGMSHGRAMD